MKLYGTTLSLILTIFLLVSCAEQITDPGNNSGDNKSSLAKIISPWYTWTTYTYWDDLYNNLFTVCTEYYSFTFDGYDFVLHYFREWNPDGFTNYIEVNVNGNYCTTISWTNDEFPINPRTVSSVWFYVGIQKMNLAINLQEFYIPMSIHSEPYTVRVALQDGK